MSKTREKDTISDKLEPVLNHTDFYELLHQQVCQAVRRVLESVMQEKRD